MASGSWLVTIVEARLVVIFEDFEQVAVLGLDEDGQPPVVEDQKLGRMAQIRKPRIRRESLSGLKCQTRSTSAPPALVEMRPASACES